MNITTSQSLYAVFAPWLALSLLIIGRNPHPPRMRLIVSILLAAILLCLPVSGFTLCRWIALLEPNPSITLTTLLAIALLARVGWTRLFRTQDWRAAWIFGSIAALILYPMGLGLSAIDPYSWGWQWYRPIIPALITTVLLLKGNRFGIILILALLGMLFSPMESTNAWDCLIDPFYAFTSLIMTGVALYKISTGHSGSALRKALP